MLNFILVFSICSFLFTANAQSSPEGLAKLWIKAIKSHSGKDMRLLIHPKCPIEAIKSEFINRMISGPFPEKYKIEVKELNAPLGLLEKTYQSLLKIKDGFLPLVFVNSFFTFSFIKKYIV